jgi:hypothetical protein
MDYHSEKYVDLHSSEDGEEFKSIRPLMESLSTTPAVAIDI